ncbi:transcriptional regulator with XRE-family HTH domain [Kitasatospora sp. MAA4]|uniref:helix-turn-helix domain-containing protein n=1 Tax=Kitasatospora sp. MAA4 TaxID=3035093 RepID=UPI002472F4D9|nr:helix-turn-helix transcriptional regulator [Kitasatospora sp. MAA4]MDH6132607.1 transcriptional regulator with XRE-family HTH domain [Kitasatospora sp. MAA4]
MSKPNSDHTGKRIANLRKLRRLTQIQLADQALISHSLLSKVEQGVVPASPSLLGALSRALRVPATDLVGQPYLTELRQDELDVLIQPIRDALDLYDLGPVPGVQPGTLAELHQKSEELCARMRQTDLKRVASELPAMIAKVTTFCYLHPSDAAWRTLTSLYRTAYDVATKLGYPDLSVIALDRLEWTAQRASDPVWAGIRQYLRTLAYMRSSLPAVGQRLIETGFAHLAQAPTGRERDVATGQLHLGAAVVAARGKDEAAALLHIDEARRIAALTGPADEVHWLSFSPTNVEVHHVGVLVDLDQPGEAVERAHGVRIPDDWPRSRVAHHYSEVARAELLTGKTDDALASMLKARKVAPQQTRYHPTSRDTISGLLSARRSVPDSLTNLAHWAGV